MQMIPSVELRSEERADLQAIHEAKYQIGIWERTLSSTLNGETATLAQKYFDAFQFLGNCDDLATALCTFSEKYHLHLSATLQQDVVQLAKWFVMLVNVPNVRVLFGRVTGDMCQRFHTDIVRLRLLCTYHGPGTLWAEPDAIEEKHIARGINEQMIKNENGIHQVATGHVALLKGALHDYSQFGAVLHRSPSIEEFGLERLILRMDTNRLLDI